MTIPLDEWQQQVIQTSVTMVEEAQPTLIAIVERACLVHGPLPLDNPDMAMPLARILNDVQNESFQLGLKMGMKVIVDVLSKKPQESKAD